MYEDRTGWREMAFILFGTNLRYGIITQATEPNACILAYAENVRILGTQKVCAPHASPGQSNECNLLQKILSTLATTTLTV